MYSFSKRVQPAPLIIVKNWSKITKVNLPGTCATTVVSGGDEDPHAITVLNGPCLSVDTGNKDEAGVRLVVSADLMTGDNDGIEGGS